MHWQADAYAQGHTHNKDIQKTNKTGTKRGRKRSVRGYIVMNLPKEKKIKLSLLMYSLTFASIIAGESLSSRSYLNQSFLK